MCFWLLWFTPKFFLSNSWLVLCFYLISFNSKFIFLDGIIRKHLLFFFHFKLSSFLSFFLVSSVDNFWGSFRIFLFFICNKIFLFSDLLFNKICDHWRKFFHFLFLKLLLWIVRVWLVRAIIFVFFIFFSSFFFKFFNLLEQFENLNIFDILWLSLWLTLFSD